MLAVPVDLIEPGMTVWALNADDTDADMRTVKGGTVISIDQRVDGDTGEIERCFTTATPWRGDVRFDFLTEREVAQVEPLNVAACRNLIRAAAAAVAKSKRIITTDEARCIDLQYRMKEILG